MPRVIISNFQYAARGLYGPQYFTAELVSNGDGSGVSYVRLWFSVDTEVTLSGAGRWYSDLEGTLDESTSYTFTAGSLVQRYFKVPSGTSTMTVKTAVANWLRWGDNVADGYNAGYVNNAKLIVDLESLTGLTYLRFTGFSEITGELPPNLTYLSLYGTAIEWVNTDALPSGITILRLIGVELDWIYNGALPVGLTYLTFWGPKINYTTLSIPDAENITTLKIRDFRTSKMSDADIITLLGVMETRTGDLPVLIEIGDYINFAAPPAPVTAAIAAVILAKSTTTIDLFV